MQKRLVGREQEFGIEILPPFDEKDAQPISKYYYGGSGFEAWRSNFVNRLLEEIRGQAPCHFSGYGERVWFANGSLIYRDQQTIEIANAESLAGSFDGLLQEKASELIAVAAARAVVEKLKPNINSFLLYKNNVGPADVVGRPWGEVTYGSHHNYSYLNFKTDQIFAILANFLPVSLPLSGSGHIFRSPFTNDSQYVLSQRASHIECDQSHDTTQRRPLVNTKGEPLMEDAAKLGRLHIISRDATRCELQTWLVDTITHLVFRLVEEGWELPLGQSLLNPLNELQRINFLLLSEKDYQVECRNGQKVDLFDYNRLFLNAAKQLSMLSDAEKLCLREWERILDLLKARAFDKLVGELDWATKWFLMKKKMAQHNFGPNSVQAFKINMGYHNISPSPKESWFARLDEDGYIKHLVSQEDIEKAKSVAPNTRAKSREQLINLFRDNPWMREKFNRVEIDWSRALLISDKDTRQTTIYFGEPENPFSPYSSTLRRFCGEFKLEPR